MSAIGEIVIGMSAKHGKLKADLARGAGHLDKFSAGAIAAGSLAADFASRGIDAAAGALGRAFTSAVDLEDELSKVGVIFGPAAGAITDQADQMAEQFGASRVEYIRAASSFGAVFKGIGKSQEDAAGLGNQLAQLGMDMASFEGVANEEAFTAISSALRGEFDPIERFRVFLSAAKIEAKALEMGLAATKGEIDDTDKKTATLALVMEQTADAQGDLARTSGATKNQMNLLKGSIANTAENIFTTLLPSINDIVKSLNSFLGPALDWVGFLTRNFGDIWEIAGLQITERVSNLLEWIGVIPANLGMIAEYVAGNWQTMIVDAINFVDTAFENLGANLAGLAGAIIDFVMDPTGGFNFEFTPLLDGFVATTAQLPELIRPQLTDMGSEIGTVLDRIAAREGERAAGAAVATAEGVATAALEETPSAVEDATEAAEAVEVASKAAEGPSLAGAMEAGSEEARRTLLAHRAAGSSVDLSIAKGTDATAKNTAQIAATLKRMERGSEEGGTTIPIPA